MPLDHNASAPTSRTRNSSSCGWQSHLHADILIMEMNRYECQPMEISQSLFRTLLTLCLRSVPVVSLLKILSWALPGDFDISLLSQFFIELPDNLVGFPLLTPKVSTNSSAVTYCVFILSPCSLLSHFVRILFHHYLYYYLLSLSIDFPIATYHEL